MPRKIRELIKDLRQAGFVLDRQRGSHRQFKHPSFQGIISLSCGEGADAKTYQERQVTKAIAERNPWARISPQNVAMKSEDRYYRFVRWSDEDECYIGYCPDLYYGGVCHGDQEESTYADLCVIVRDEVVHRIAKGEALPEPFVRVNPDLDIAAA